MYFSSLWWLVDKYFLKRFTHSAGLSFQPITCKAGEKVCVAEYLLLSWALSWSWWWWGWWAGKRWSRSPPEWYPLQTAALWPSPADSTYTQEGSSAAFQYRNFQRTSKIKVCIFLSTSCGSRTFIGSCVKVCTAINIHDFHEFGHHLHRSFTLNLAEEWLTATHDLHAWCWHAYLY